MYQTVSKRTRQGALALLVIFALATLPTLPILIVSAIKDDYSQYTVADSIVTLLLVLLAASIIAFAYYLAIALVLYSRTVCSVCDSGIKVYRKFPREKERLFGWNDIDKVFLAACSNGRTELEFRCFTFDFMTKGRGFARKFPPESKLWSDPTFVVLQQKRMVTIQYTPELLETIKQYHPDIILYPNEKVVEGYADYINAKII